MKSGEMVSVVRLPPVIAQRRRDELEFLPAALEIIETPASPLGRAIACSIILFFVLAVAWACVGKVDIIATAPGRIIPSGKTKVIQPFETGVVRAIHVNDGNAVQAGDVLLEVDPTANEADVTRLEHDLKQDQLDIARLEALLAGRPDAFTPPGDADPSLIETARRQMQAQAAEQEAKLQALIRQIAEKHAEENSVTAAIAKLDAALPMLKGQRDIRKELLENEFGSKLLYLQAEQQVVEQEHQRVVLQHQLDETREAVGALDRQRAQCEAGYGKMLLADLAKAKGVATEHREEAIKAAERRGLQTLRAPIAGTVQQLAVHTLGGVVTPAQPLMAIVPGDTALEIEATLANRDIGFVHTGQAVEIKVETFNFTRYGLLHGTVRDVSRDVVAAEGASGRTSAADVPKDDHDRQVRQATYVVRVALTETGIATEQGWTPLEPGMAVTTEIKTGQRRVISYLLSPLIRYRQESLRER